MASANLSPWAIVYPLLVDMNGSDEVLSEELKDLRDCLVNSTALVPSPYPLLPDAIVCAVGDKVLFMVPSLRCWHWLKPESVFNFQRPRIRSLKMANSIDHIVKKYNSDGPNFISPESAKNIACVGQKTKRFWKNKVPCMTYT